MPTIKCECGKTETINDAWQGYGSDFEICVKTLKVYCANCAANKTLICITCGIIFRRARSHKKSRKFCCRECYIVFSRNLPTQEYKRIWREGKRIYLHRLVYEQATGERLGPYDIVHHVDGNKLNNDPGNLERLTGRAAHLHRHNYHKNPAQRFDDDIPF